MPRPAPNVQLAERAEVRVVVDLHLDADPRARAPRAALRPTQPGRIVAELTICRPRSYGPGRPMPAPTTRSRSSPPARGRRRRAGPRCRAPRRRRGRRRPERRLRRGSADERSATATRTWEWPRSMPSATPADGSRRRSAGGRPRPPERATSRRRRRRRRGPRFWRSPTSVATVVRDRPVSWASSLRVAVPLRRSASTTRRRFPSRSASREPSAASPRTPATFSRRGCFCQDLG